MKIVKSFTLSEDTVELLESMSENSKPHVSKSSLVEEAIIDYSQKINYKEEQLEANEKNGNESAKKAKKINKN